MLRRVILSSKQLLANFCQRSSQRGSLHNVNGRTEFVVRPDKRVTEKANSGLFQLPKTAFQLKISVKRFVARPDKSLSTTARTLCQEFFMVKLVFFNALSGFGLGGCSSQTRLSNSDAAMFATCTFAKSSAIATKASSVR